MSLTIQGKLDVQHVLTGLDGFSEGMGRGVIRNALDSAARVMKNKAREIIGTQGGGYKGTPGVETGLLKRSIDVRVRTYPAKNLVLAVIGPKRGMASTQEIKPDRVYRQMGGTRATRTIPGVFGVTRRFRKPYPNMLSRKEDPAKIGHFVEGGHLGGTRKAYPFMRPAFLQSKAEAEAKFVEKIKLGVERLAYAMPRGKGK